MRNFLITLGCLLFLSCVAFYYTSAPSNVEKLEAQDGQLILDNSLDFTDTLYQLDGNWEFYYGALYEPGDFIAGKPSGGTYITVPSNWADSGYSLAGCATYRLTIQADALPMKEFMILIPEIPMSSKIFINGQERFNAGQVTADSNERFSSVRNAFVDFTSQGGNIEIVIQVSNYEWVEAGITYAITMGTSPVLLHDALTRRIYLAIFIGILVMMSTYHFILFLFRRQDYLYLIFSLYCLFDVVKFVLETNGFAQLFFRNGLTLILIRVYLLSMIAASTMGTLFLYHLFQIAMKKTYAITLFSVFYGLPAVLCVIVPFQTFGINFMFLPLIGITPFLFLIFAQKLVRNRYDILNLFACMLFVIWAPLTKIIWNDALFMPGVASTIFLILVQCFILSHKYVYYQTEAYRLAENNRILEELSHMKTHFIQNINHEAKTPLTVISTDIQYVHSCLLWEKDHDELCLTLQNAQDEVMRMARLMEGTLNFAVKDESLDHMELLHVSTFLHGIKETYQPLCAAHGNRLKIIASDSLPDLIANLDMLKQVFSNLINNACRHTHSDTIEICVTYVESELLFTVTDHGCGIAPENLPHIWERHVSLDGRSGLGLSICKTLITLHHGKISIESKPNEGTVVSITLPISQSAKEEENHYYD
jgi:signal transduction histidine kinase